jgi:hypothetical protein
VNINPWGNSSLSIFTVISPGAILENLNSPVGLELDILSLA